MEGGMSEYQQLDVIVVGGGIFGCLTAIELTKSGLDVSLFEKNNNIMQEASLNNQNRLHLGYHYPRDLETAKQCQRGFYDFKNRFSRCILDNFDNIYCISNKNSKTSFVEYKNFCNKAKLVVNELNLNTFNPTILNVDGGLYTNEVVYDSKILANLILEEMSDVGVDLHLNTPVKSIMHKSNGFEVVTHSGSFFAKSVVNCTYSNFNNFMFNFGLEPQKLQYELTLVPVIRWREGCDPIGITLMDGEFFTVLPFGKSENYLLYHVDHAVQETYVGFEYPLKWKNPKTYITKEAAEITFKKIVQATSSWLPDILNAELVDYLVTVRVVLADVDSTDRRPSLINKLPFPDPYYVIFSGKIDHSIWVAKEINDNLCRELLITI
jgi:glycine/D-amino acid oxidase-like deaminating enzyme